MALWILPMGRHTIRQAVTSHHVQEAGHEVSQFGAYLAARAAMHVCSREQ
jgi:hypothetical protein